MFVPAKLKWFDTNRPEVYRNIATVLTISGWIIYRLCGERVSEACGASELGLVDNRSRQWSQELRRLLALPSDIYPELAPAGSQVGKVTPQAASETGIAEGTPVVPAAPDTHCGLLAMGVKEKGQVGIILGWSAPVQMVTGEVILDPEAKIWTGCHLFAQRWLLESNAGEAGNAYHWLRELLFGRDESSPDDAYELMDSLARAVPPGTEEVLAFIGPAAMDMRRLTLRRGGFFFPVPTSVSNIQRGHLVRAALENIGYAVKANCLQLEAISGLKIGDVAIGGGLTRSRCLTEILPAVLNTPVSIPQLVEVSALGAAMCAAAGSGIYSGVEEAAGAMKPEMRVVAPEPLAALEYAGCYQKWVAASEWLERLSEAGQ
jgi:autoinducer 2 (AI-2) kinase